MLKAKEAIEDIILTADLYREVVTRGRTEVKEIQGPEPTIIAIHGIFGGWHSTVEEYFKKRHQHTFLLDWGVQTGHFDSYVERLVNFVNDNKLNKVVLFGMSVGGLIAIEAANKLGEAVQKVITDATPYQGIAATKFADIFDGVRELRKDSPILRRVLNGKFPHSQILCVRGLEDPMLVENGKPPETIQELLIPFGVHSKNQLIGAEMVDILNTYLK